MNPLKSIPMTVGLGFILAIIISLSLNHGDPANSLWSLATWLHVFFGIIWIGLLYYFGFFIIITPLIGWIEKPKTLPLSISDVYLGGGKEAPAPVTQKEIH